MFGNILELFSHAGYMNERKQFHIEILSLFRSQHFFLYVGGIWFLFGWLFRLVCFIKYIFRQCLFEVAAQPIDFIETAFCILQGFLSIQMLQACLNIDQAIIGLVIHTLVHFNFHAAQNIHNVLETIKIRDRIIIDRHIQELLHCGAQQIHAAIGKGMIQLVLPMTIDIHQSIPGKR